MLLKVIGTGSKGNCYLLEPKQGKSIIIDCGVDFKKVKQAINFELITVAGCLQTHSHGDHSKYTKEFLSAGIEVYMSSENKKEIKLDSHRLKIIEPFETFNLGDFRIKCFPLVHDVMCLGFLIFHKEFGNTIFITDTCYCKYKFKNLNNIIIEANYSKEIIDKNYQFDEKNHFLKNRIISSHLSFENLKLMLLANDISNVNKIVVTHLSDSNSDENSFKTELQELTGKSILIAGNGIEIELNKTPF